MLKGYYRWAIRNGDKHYPIFARVDRPLEDGGAAECVRRNHSAPHLGCGCGYYSTRSWYILSIVRAEIPDPYRVDLLQVHPWGVVLEDEH
ncbi:MAG: hypothetical protein QW815_05115, partial [Nitrososphaerota archaeon]